MAGELTLRQEIRNALTTRGTSTPDEGVQTREEVVEKISAAIEHYVKINMISMANALKMPGAFQGVGTGTVVVNATGFNAYNP